MNFYCKTKPIIDVKIFSNNIKFIQADEQYIKLQLICTVNNVNVNKETALQTTNSETNQDIWS